MREREDLGVTPVEICDLFGNIEEIFEFNRYHTGDSSIAPDPDYWWQQMTVTRQHIFVTQLQVILPVSGQV